MRGLLMQKPINGRITLSGYEGSELLVGAFAGSNAEPICAMWARPVLPREPGTHS